MRGWALHVDEETCEVSGQGAGLVVGERVIVKLELGPGELVVAKARVVDATHARAFFVFERLPLDVWDRLSQV